MKKSLIEILKESFKEPDEFDYAIVKFGNTFSQTKGDLSFRVLNKKSLKGLRSSDFKTFDEKSKASKEASKLNKTVSAEDKKHREIWTVCQVKNGSFTGK